MKSSPVRGGGPRSGGGGLRLGGSLVMGPSTTLRVVPLPVPGRICVQALTFVARIPKSLEC